MIGNIVVLSPDGAYRYVLWREIRQRDLLIPERGVVNFIMLNPSTADAENDDPTMRRVIDYAARWGFRRLVVTNLFALRSTDPRALLDHVDPVGMGNDAAIRECAAGSEMVVAAWGLGPGPSLKVRDRARAVAKMVGRRLHCVELTDDGVSPRHPLYLSKTRQPVPFAP